MNDYGLIRRESDSNKAPQDEQTDWLAGRARHFLPSEALLPEFPFQSAVASWEASGPGAWVGGVRPPHCQQWLASSSTAWRLCFVLLLLLFSLTPVSNHREFVCSTIFFFPVLHLPIFLSLPPPLFLCKHLAIFKHNVITPKLSSCSTHRSWKSD